MKKYRFRVAQEFEVEAENIVQAQNNIEKVRITGCEYRIYKLKNNKKALICDIKRIGKTKYKVLDVSN